MIRNNTLPALLFAAFLTTPALAEEPPREASALPHLVTVSATVEYGDVDLRTPAGLAEVERRAARVARDMCRPQAVPAGPGRGRVDGHCFREAMASARAQLDRVLAARNAPVRTALNASPVGNLDD